MTLSTAVIAAVASVFVAILTVLLGTWVKRNDDTVKRNDQAVKLTQASMKSMAQDFKLFHALRDDYWDLDRWARIVERRWHMLQDILRNNGVITESEVIDLPSRPASRLAEMERKLEAEKDADDD